MALRLSIITPYYSLNCILTSLFSYSTHILLMPILHYYSIIFPDMLTHLRFSFLPMSMLHRSRSKSLWWSSKIKTWHQQVWRQIEIQPSKWWQVGAFQCVILTRWGRFWWINSHLCRRWCCWSTMDVGFIRDMQCRRILANEIAGKVSQRVICWKYRCNIQRKSQYWRVWECETMSQSCWRVWSQFFKFLMNVVHIPFL